MPDLKVTFGSLEFKNPFVVASASTSKNLQQVKDAEAAGAAGVILKAIVTKHPYLGKPFYYQDKKGGAFYNASCPRLLADEGVELIKACKKETKIPIIANTMGSGGNLDSWADICKKLADAGADMIEINLGCPNIGVMQKSMGKISGDEDQVLGAVCGQSPVLASNIVKAVKSVVKIPLLVKMTPLAADMAAVAQACLDAGAETIDISNGHHGIPGLDIYNDGRPLFQNYEKMPFCGTVGPHTKKFTLKNIATLAMKNPDAEIMGSGGLMNWKDSVEAIMLGAKLAAYCTTIYWYGWDVFTESVKGLEKFMAEKGYNTIEDFRRTALKYIVPHEEVVCRYVMAQVDESKCTGCGICAKPGHCDAITMVDRKPVVNTDRCLGCAVCSEICPTGAMRMVPNPRPVDQIPTH